MKRKILISLICVLTLLTISKVQAAIAIVPNTNATGADAIVNTTISNSFSICRQMTERGESLYGTTVVPHLATNKDWGAVAYLSNSAYGTNTTGGAKGIEIEINGVKHYSTTTNISGVMNFGANPNKTTFYTQTSGIISTYDNTTSTAATFVKELYENMGTRFVDTYDGTKATHIGMATLESSGIYESHKGLNISNNNRPISLRTSMFGFCFGSAGMEGETNAAGVSGAAKTVTTFRPAIWNK